MGINKLDKNNYIEIKEEISIPLVDKNIILEVGDKIKVLESDISVDEMINILKKSNHCSVSYSQSSISNSSLSGSFYIHKLSRIEAIRMAGKDLNIILEIGEFDIHTSFITRVVKDQFGGANVFHLFGVGQDAMTIAYL